MIGRILAAAALVPLASCSTLSFAPPSVTTDRKVTNQGMGQCVPSNQARGTTVEIKPDVIGATNLVNNFVLAYSCAESELANGRQVFQLPAFLAAAAGLIGPSVGMPKDAVLGTGVGAAVFGFGNSYYAPKQKAAIVNSAVRAVLCVKTESVGVSFFRASEAPAAATPTQANIVQLQGQLARLNAENAALTARLLADKSVQSGLSSNEAERRETMSALTQAILDDAADTGDGTIEMDAARQYFEMVGAALFGIHTILAERMRDAGSADTTDIFAKLKNLTAQSAALEPQVPTTRQTAAQNRQKVAMAVAQGNDPSALRAQARASQREAVRLENLALQPKLQICVLQARL